ncbi:MAG TPA: hypothetical protein VHT91_24535 [Kofleriaceae bacterium]|nr:hypothetical protein [Kofleriaceae bacterium]
MESVAGGSVAQTSVESVVIVLSPRSFIQAMNCASSFSARTSL